MIKIQNFFKKFFIFIIIIIFIIAFSASYNTLNIDNLAFVVALGIDVSDSKDIKVTFQFVNLSSTSEGTNQESKIIEDSIDTNSIPNAINIMNTYLARKLDLSHCRIIVFSEEIAQRGISDYVYSLMNDVQVRPSANIIVSKCNSDYYIKNSIPSLETSITRYYDIFPNSSKYTGYMSNATIGDFFNSLICNYCQPYAILGGITSSTSSTSQSTDASDSNIKSGSSPISGTRASENIGMAIFKYDKLVGELNAIETLSFHILQNDINSFLVSVPNPEQKNSNIDLLITPKTNTKINVEITNGSPYVKIDCSFSAKIYSMNEGSNYSNPSALSSIAESCNNYLESVLSQYLYKSSLEFKSDVTEIGKYVLSDFITNQDFESYNWNNNFVNSTFDVNVDTNIDSGFLLNKT